jgi:hypothetical protein
VLVDTIRQMGTTSRTPMLWVYAKNDSFFGPALAHRFRDAFVAGGGKVTFVDAPAFGNDGHFLFSVDSVSRWTPYVDNFLRTQKLPARTTATTSVSSSLGALPAPPQLSEGGRDEFLQYISHGRAQGLCSGAQRGVRLAFETADGDRGLARRA